MFYYDFDHHFDIVLTFILIISIHEIRVKLYLLELNIKNSFQLHKIILIILITE